jgi:hypothetical protein
MKAFDLYGLLQNNGLIVFSDAAGAKACLAFAEILKIRGFSASIKLISNKQYDFYNDWSHEVLVLENFSPNHFDEETDWLFTGTSHPDRSQGFELYYIAEAEQRNIVSYSFIDHWTNFLLRFQLKNEIVLPGRVIVLDELAKQNAILDGIPNECVLIHKNPYIEYIEKYRAARLSFKEVRNLMGISNSVKVVLYAPDPISISNTDNSWDFDEISALQDIAEVTSDFEDIVVLIKKHPLQPANTLELFTFDHNNIKMARDGIDNLELILNADLIIGFFSNMLIEANALDKKIIRYFPASLHKDSIAHLQIGEIVESKTGLKNTINKLLYNI